MTRADEELKQQLAFLRDLKAALKRPRGKRRIAPSLQSQLVGLVGHALKFRLGVIHPGVSKMADWARVSERAARSNMRVLEHWNVAIPVGSKEGGRGQATEYLLDFKALYTTLNLCGCKPSGAMKEFCERKAEVVRNIPVSRQRLEVHRAHILQIAKMARKPGTIPTENPEANPEETSARLKRVMVTLPPGGQLLPFPPSAGRSADASLVCFSSVNKTVSARASNDCQRPAEPELAFIEFCRIYPRHPDKSQRAQAAFFRAIDRGHSPERIIAGATSLRKRVQAREIEVRHIPAAENWLQAEAWDDDDCQQLG